jgi:Ras family protein A
VELSIWDTAGQEDYDRLRPLSYPNTHTVLICFSVENPESFENIEQKWVPEIAQFCPGVPFILVGCKTDLRNDHKTKQDLIVRGRKTISRDEGAELAKRVGAREYVECSAKSGEGVKHVFQIAASIAITYNPEKKRESCIIT